MTPVKSPGIAHPAVAAAVLFFFFGSAASAFAKTADVAGMVLVPEGYFGMGANAPAPEEETPQHQVYVSAYYIDKHEVSNAQYAEFMKATGHPAPAFWADENFNKPEFPVVGVSWMDAAAYAKWKGGRLPTEAEWEKAARGTDLRPFPWGDKWAKGMRLNFLNIFGVADGYQYAATTTAFPAGASPYGVFNMAGNVWEWCLDWFKKDYYGAGPEINPEGPPEKTNPMKVLRGGSWINDIDNVRATHRGRNFPYVKNTFYGFRIVKPAR
jgi:formylglycine-generating enzyme required for sulfatase activity